MVAANASDLHDFGPFVMPPEVNAAHITQDGDFLHRLIGAGMTVTDSAGAVHAAHISCTELAQGYSVYDIAVADKDGNPGMDMKGLQQWIRMAAAVYCPDRA